MRYSNRSTEGKLLVFASFVLLLGLALVFAAKSPQLKTDGTVNINTSTPAKLCSGLGIDSGTAHAICDYRSAHGSFSNTSSLGDIRLLSRSEVSGLLSLSKGTDVTELSASQLSARSGLGVSASERLVDSFAAMGSKTRITEKALSRIRLLDEGTLDRLDKRMRVRDPGPVILGFWVYAFLMIVGFLMLHAIIRRRSPGIDPFILPVVLLLCGLGAATMFSIKDPIRDMDVYPRQMQGILLGIVAAMVPFTARFRSAKLWRYTYVYAISATAITVLLALVGTGPGGAKLQLLGFQPSELVRIALVFFVASYLADRWMVLLDKTPPSKSRGLRIPLFRDTLPLAVMYLLSLATFVLVRDLGPMLLLFGMFVSLLYVVTGRPAFIVVGVALVAFTGWIAYHFHLGVFDVRVDMWLSPWTNKHPNGMQLGQALWGFGTGGIWGSGLGLGRPDVMSRAGSDLVFASLGEELGLIGSLTILTLFSIVIARGFRIALHARTDFERLLAAGLTTLLGAQVVVIVFGVLGLVPLTGVTLPFVSYGKSSVIASFLVMGLLLSISANEVRDTSGMRDESKRAVRWLTVVFIACLLGVGGVARLMWIQGVKADQIAGATVTTPDADGSARPHINPRLKAIEAAIPRGSIYDRNGRLLATSRVTELRSLGVMAEAERRPLQRYYPSGSGVSHLVGYVDPRCGGPVGLERSENGDLRGFDDYSALLPVYRLARTPYCPKIVGRDIRLTIDSRIQSAVEKALRKYAGAVRDLRTGQPKHKAAAVVLDVYTGEVLAAVSIPNFDPNSLTPGVWKSYNGDQGSEAVLLDRAQYGIYPPGSTFKLVTAAAALENGADMTYNCPHEEHDIHWRWEGKPYARRKITDLEEMRAHGRTDLAKAIRVSCNIYFAHLGLKLGPEKLFDMTRRFKLRRIAPAGRLAEDLPDNAYGQGIIQVSPLEMARVVATIANDGVMMRPHFVRDIRSGGKVLETIKPAEMGRPISHETAEVLRKAMAQVTTIGTGKGLFSGVGVSVAGKTGSAENDQADKRPHSWFVGFAPVKDPRIAFVVVVENGGYGRAVAGPVCREIVKAAL